MCKEKPKPPTPRYIRDSTSELCPKCKSSLLRRLHFFWVIGCVNPNCTNYYKGFPNEKTDYNYKIYK